jgi:hypothetical protein
MMSIRRSGVLEREANLGLGLDAVGVGVDGGDGGIGGSEPPGGISPSPDGVARKGPGAVPAVDTLLMLDRDVDLVTPLVTPLTYEGLLDEVVGIDGGHR